MQSINKTIPTNNRWFQIDKYGPGDVLACASLTEEGVEGIVSTTDGLVRGHLAIRLDSVLQTVQLPTGVAHLDSGLADMDWDTLTLERIKKQIYNIKYGQKMPLDTCIYLKLILINSQNVNQSFRTYKSWLCK